MKRALVVGAAGQDGRILTEQLLARGVEVVGIDRGVGEIDLLDRRVVDAFSQPLGDGLEVEAGLRSASHGEVC